MRAFTPARPCSTRSTVAVETPASRATSTMVGRPLVAGLSSKSALLSERTMAGARNPVNRNDVF